MAEGGVVHVRAMGSKLCDPQKKAKKQYPGQAHLKASRYYYTPIRMVKIQNTTPPNVEQ